MSLHVFKVQSSLSRAKSLGSITAQAPFRAENGLEAPGAGRTLPTAAAPWLGEDYALEAFAFRCTDPAVLERRIEAAHALTLLGWSECRPHFSRG